MPNPPVCNVQGVAVVPDQTLGRFAPVPRATDLRSALRAIQIITNNFNILYGMIPPNNLNPPQTGNITGATSKTQGDWVEDRGKRIITKVKVEQKDNPENFVEFEQIDGFTMKNAKSGEVWKWQR